MKENRAGSRWVAGLSVALLALAGCSRQEAADWKQATLADSSEAYQLFLQQHPHSAEATQAQARVQQLAEQRDWQVASAADTRDSYQLFLQQHADSKWTQEARIRIENFAQAGVSGGAALAAAAGTPGGVSPGAGSARDANINDASPPAGTPGGATVAPGDATTLPASGSAHRERAAQRLTHAAHPAARVARNDRHRAHSKLVARNQARSRTLQLGAFRSRASAESEWHHLAAHYSTLKGLRPRYVAASAHAGRVYRLEVRGSSVAAANGVCASLHRRAHSCVRVIA